jgi:hypothetical protein
MLGVYRGLDRHDRAVHGWKMKHGVKLSARSRSGIAPSVRALGLRMLHKVEDLDVALPDRLTFVRLVNRNALYPVRVASVHVADGVLQRLRAGRVGHRPSSASAMFIARSSQQRNRRSSSSTSPIVAKLRASVTRADIQIRTVPHPDRDRPSSRPKLGWSLARLTPSRPKRVAGFENLLGTRVAGSMSAAHPPGIAQTDAALDDELAIRNGEDRRRCRHGREVARSSGLASARVSVRPSSYDDGLDDRAHANVPRLQRHGQRSEPVLKRAGADHLCDGTAR